MSIINFSLSQFPILRESSFVDVECQNCGHSETIELFNEIFEMIEFELRNGKLRSECDTCAS